MIVIGPASLVWSVDFATSDGGFVDGGETAQWEWGDVVEGPTVIGPVWATNLSGVYLHDTDDWLEIQLPDLSTVAQPSLVLTQWYAIREGDQAFVEIDQGGGSFVRLTPAMGYPAADGFVGTSTAWQDAVFDLSGVTSAPKVRLRVISDLTQADLGWYVSDVAVWDGDVLPPTIEVLAPPEDTQDLAGPYVVQAEVEDDQFGPTATLWYALDGGFPKSLPMTGSPATASIPGQPPDTSIALWIEASDGNNVGRWPAVGQHVFRVFLAPPVDVTADVPPGVRPLADHVSLAWSPPDSPHEVVGYRVVYEGSTSPVVETAGTSVAVPLTPDEPQRFQVRALYDVGLSDPSEVVELSVEVPALDAVTPSVVFPGQEAIVRLEGRSLYLLDGATVLDLGAGVEVLDLDVRDVDEAVAQVQVAHGAALGPRDVILSGGAGTFVFEGALAIGDPADEPRITSLAPGTLTRGETRAFVAEASVPFGARAELYLDPDLILVSPPTVDGDTLAFSLSARAGALLGPHSVGIDDGERLYTVEVEVLDDRGSLRAGCSTTRGPASSALVALFFALLVRRRAPSTGPTR